MPEALIIDAMRTPMGRYRGALSGVRPDDLAALVVSGALRLGEGEVFLAGGVESMSRAPWVVPKPAKGLPRGPQTMHDTALGWRLVNPRMEAMHSTESMGETAENVAERYDISREDQDAYALRSHQRAVAAQDRGVFGEEIVAIETPPPRKGTGPLTVGT